MRTDHYQSNINKQASFIQKEILVDIYFKQITISQNVIHSNNIFALLSDMRLDPSASIMDVVFAVTIATATITSRDMRHMDVLSIGITSANVKSKYVGEIAKMLSIGLVFFDSEDWVVLPLS